MQASSILFFGLILVPLLFFLFWLVKQDKNKNYLGLMLLFFGIVIAIYTILRLDVAFVKEKGLQQQGVPKPSSFK